MKAVILAAGSSTRMYPLTLTRPKPLLKIANKTILEHNLEALAGFIDEAVIVVGYKQKMIIDLFKYNFKGIKISYVEQKEQLGTGHALKCAQKLIEHEQKFIIMPGDDLFSRKDIGNCLKHDFCVLVKEVTDPEKWGIILADEDNRIIDIEEKPKSAKSNMANTALWVMGTKILELLPKKKTERGELELTSALAELIKCEKVYSEQVTGYWLPIGYPWHILDANEFLLFRVKSSIQGEVSPSATVGEKVAIGKRSEILAGAYIEGKVIIGDDCKIGPNCYIRGSTSIGNHCHIGQAVEIKNSIIGDNTNICHLSYVGDSVIGERVNLGAGTIIANLRHDRSNVKSMVKGEKVDTGRLKFGAVIGDSVHTGINTNIYPGRKLWPNTTTLPGEIVREDKIE